MRAEALPRRHAGILTMASPCSGLGSASNGTSSGELLDLLEYLALGVDGFKPAYEKLDGKLLIPMLTHPAGWHCSPPRDMWFTRVTREGTHGAMLTVGPTATSHRLAEMFGKAFESASPM